MICITHNLDISPALRCPKCEEERQSETPRTDEALRHTGSTYNDVVTRCERLIECSRSMERELTALKEEQHYSDLEHEHLGCHVAKTGIYAAPQRPMVAAPAITAALVKDMLWSWGKPCDVTDPDCFKCMGWAMFLREGRIPDVSDVRQ